MFLLGLPLVGWLLWWWNEIWFVTPVKARCSSTNIKMLPGHLGFPFFGEMLTFLWYFKILRRPDDFIYSKIRKYGENVGAYRTYLFGSPSILVCSPALSKVILNSPDTFKQAWPTTEAQGPNSVISLEGAHHDRVKSLLLNAINHPHALARIAIHVQPAIVHALQSWAQKGKITTLDELKKVTLLNMGRYFASLDFGPQHHSIEQILFAITQGFRAQPSKIPGSAYRYAVKCRTKFKNIIRVELEKRKQQNKNANDAKDLMDELMQMKDEEGKKLTDEEVLDNIVSSIHVGYISTAYLSTWALYFVAKNPDVLHKLREENMELAKDKRDQFITYEDVLKLKYTNKVVEETVRLANLSGFVFRKTTEDVDYKGYLIPKDWKIIVWIRHLHVDPANFENPMGFNPDRWDIRPKVGTFYAFGGGWKSCPGNMLVRLQLILLLHHLSIGYKWELLNPDVKLRYLSHPIPTDGLQLFVSEI